jgi:tetratricopeptide (TPR) repeat protein
MLNFLAQVYVAMGLFEDAEAVLRDVIASQKDSEEPVAVRGYNLALLGKLYLEWSRVGDARIPLLAGWKETQATWNVAVAPLVRNYYAELLMHSDNGARDLAEAGRQLEANLNETSNTGFHRSEIAALSLRGQLALMQGKLDDAVKYSGNAIDELEKRGTMPALRTEEVLFNHYLVLKASDRLSEALSYLEQARNVLQQKASSMNDESHRRSFLESTN